MTATVPTQRPADDDPHAANWALVERAQAGDSAAFAAIYDRHVDMVFRFIYFRCGNRALAEDLTADTFLRALKRIGTFTWQGRDIGAWIITIARNIVMDYFKSGRYRLEIQYAGCDPTDWEVHHADARTRAREAEVSEPADVEVLANDASRAVLAALQLLPPDQRDCLVLRFMNGLSVGETAAAMGRNEGAVKALQWRAARSLRRLAPDLEDHYR